MVASPLATSLFLVFLRGKERYYEDVALVEFMYLVFTRTPGESSRRRLGSLLSRSCVVFRALMTSICLLILRSDLTGRRTKLYMQNLLVKYRRYQSTLPGYWQCYYRHIFTFLFSSQNIWAKAHKKQNKKRATNKHTKNCVSYEFRASLTFSCGNLYDLSNSVTEIPNVGAQQEPCWK